MDLFTITKSENNVRRKRKDRKTYACFKSVLVCVVWRRFNVVNVNG